MGTWVTNLPRHSVLNFAYDHPLDSNPASQIAQFFCPAAEIRTQHTNICSVLYVAGYDVLNVATVCADIAKLVVCMLPLLARVVRPL